MNVFLFFCLLRKVFVSVVIHFYYKSKHRQVGKIATEACYVIEEDNKEESFCRVMLPFCWHKLPFVNANWGKPILWWRFFANVNNHLNNANWEKPILQMEKSLLFCKLKKAYFVSAFFCWDRKILMTRSEIWTCYQAVLKCKVLPINFQGV